MPYHQKDSLSQNFIKYPELVCELLSCSQLDPHKLVLEIGPGNGIITQELVKFCHQLIAIEKDPLLASQLRHQFASFPHLQIINQDFLKYPLPTCPYQVFANIPFSLTAEIVSKLVRAQPRPDSMYLFMQLEAAQKFIGCPESQSSLLSKPWYEIKIIGDIDRSNFTKKPQIRVVFIEFKKRPHPFIQDQYQSLYRAFINYGFRQWQATFLESYQKIFTYSQLKQLEKSYHLSDLKLTEVSFDTWLLVFKTSLKILSPDQQSRLL